MSFAFISFGFIHVLFMTAFLSRPVSDEWHLPAYDYIGQRGCQRSSKTLALNFQAFARGPQVPWPGANSRPRSGQSQSWRSSRSSESCRWFRPRSTQSSDIYDLTLAGSAAAVVPTRKRRENKSAVCIREKVESYTDLSTGWYTIHKY